MTFLDKLKRRISASGSNLCVGLDLRAGFADETAKREMIRVIRETSAHAAAFKPNAAYYEGLGWRGLRLLSQIIKEIPGDIPIIFDVKRGDIGETQAHYAKACFEHFGADAVTLNPFMGRDTIEPFLKHQDKGLYLLAVTSNPGAKDIELQRVQSSGFGVQSSDSGEGKFVYEIVAEMTAASDQAGLVLGLTNAAEDILKRIPDVPLLIPGLGAQGGDLAALKGSGRKAPLLVNVSRGILYQEDEKPYGERAREWKEKIAAAITA